MYTTIHCKFKTSASITLIRLIDSFYKIQLINFEYF